MTEKEKNEVFEKEFKKLRTGIWVSRTSALDRFAELDKERKQRRSRIKN